MKAPSEDIKDILEACGLSLTFQENLFMAVEPSTPDDCVTIYDTPGSPPQLTLGGKADAGYYFPSVQVRVRNNAYLTGWNLIDDIKIYLHGMAGVIWNGALYTVIRCTGEPFHLQTDEEKRAVFVATFDMERKDA